MSLMSVAPAADTSVPVFCRVGEGCRLASSGGHPRRPMRDSRRAFVAIWEALHGRAPALALPSDDRFAHADLEPPRRPFIGSLRRVRHVSIPALFHIAMESAIAFADCLVQSATQALRIPPCP